MLTSHLESTLHTLVVPRLLSSIPTPSVEDLLSKDLPVIKPPSVLGGPPVAPFPDVPKKSQKRKKSHTSSTLMNEKAIDPEEDLQRLIDNEEKLRLSNYYYGYLSWVDASHLLKRSAVGTFLVRDSEHCSYLYTLSVQTRKGPTSCRINYENGLFRLDSAEDLSDKMPRFNSVTDLVDHYVHLTKNLPRTTKELSPVWLDMDEENSRDVPVQIYRPLYKSACSLQHICRLNLVRLEREGKLSRTKDLSVLPTFIKTYLQDYPYPQ